ncbi:MAG: alpha/beta hydrolase [Flavisolibacter sp.]|nr:alpha/beta hydrolase [Flavisolibacter sp.]
MAYSIKRVYCFRKLYALLILTVLLHQVQAQTPSPVQQIFPKETIFYSNIPYAGDTLKKHLLDIYLPHNAKPNTPLIVWIHGGAWMLNDKYADMSYMKNTIREFIDSGYALASIDYRWSTTAPFPAQIQDCNQALEYLYAHAEQYKLNRNRIALIGFSAGGHLASLLALSHNNGVKAFYAAGARPRFKINCVLDFYGPSDLLAASMSTDTAVNNSRSSIAMLLGAMPVERPDLARWASPVTYIDKDDPPFLIVQGEKDESVPNTQSRLLSSSLTLAGVKNELIIVPNAPHYGPMFDAEWIRKKVFRFLATYVK